jgi:hypothetical protein
MLTSRTVPPDPDLYVSQQLGFELRKPSDWVFLAAPWAATFRKRNAISNEQLREVFEKATPPFVSAHRPHDDPSSAYPTLQAACRFSPTAHKPEVLLPQMVATLSRQFADFELLEQTADAIVGGAQAIVIRSRFTLRNGEGVVFPCLGRSYTLFAPPLFFTVGISCAAEGPYCVEDEVEAIARSIRIRRRR